jgi:hypothetical protein
MAGRLVCDSRAFQLVAAFAAVDHFIVAPCCRADRLR